MAWLRAADDWSPLSTSLLVTDLHCLQSCSPQRVFPSLATRCGRVTGLEVDFQWGEFLGRSLRRGLTAEVSFDLFSPFLLSIVWNMGVMAGALSALLGSEAL